MEKSKGLDITEGEKGFIADFYKYGFVGVMLDWIGKGMKEDYTEITDRMSVTLDGSITNSIQNFANLTGKAHKYFKILVLNTIF